VPYKDGKANHGHSCVKGRFAWGYHPHDLLAARLSFEGAADATIAVFRKDLI
jgi:hypothetical protein